MAGSQVAFGSGRAPVCERSRFRDGPDLNRAAGGILLKQMAPPLKQVAPLFIIGRLRGLRPEICGIFR